MTAGYWGATRRGIPTREHLNAAINAAFGTTIQVLTLEKGKRLMLRADVGNWRIKPGKQVPQVFTTVFATDVVTMTAHGLETGDGPYFLTSGTTLPDGLALLTPVWIIKINDNTLNFAASQDDALKGNKIDILDNGTGTHTLGATALVDPAAAVADDSGYWKVGLNETLIIDSPSHLTVIGFGTNPVLTFVLS